jgi:hypothetical protein
MIKKNYFYLDESPYQPGKYTVRIDFDLMPEMTTSGSYNILFARLMNLSYAQYLRFCRDALGATIVGKRCMYPVPYFVKNPYSIGLVRLLNTRMNLIIWEREHPNWEEHEEKVREHYAEASELKKEVKNVFNT